MPAVFFMTKSQDPGLQETLAIAEVVFGDFC